MAVPFVQGHRTVSPRTPRNTCMLYTSSRTMSRHVWRVDTAPGQTRKRNRMRVKTSADPRLKKKTAGLYGIRFVLVNQIKSDVNAA